MPVSIRYRFTQKIPVQAKAAFDWCTDFTPNDHALMGDLQSERKITRISDGVMVLDEVFRISEGEVVKQKLVTLYPDRLFWVATHLTGPNQYSQFTYQITPENGGSQLEFTALNIEHDKNLTKAEVAALSERLCREDAEAWRLLATAMTKDLIKQV
jgi:hypothetical protein